MNETEPIWVTSSGRSPMDGAPFLTVHVRNRGIVVAVIPSASHIEDGPTYRVRPPRNAFDVTLLPKSFHPSIDYEVDVPLCPSWIGRWDVYSTALRILLAQLPEDDNLPDAFFDLAWRKFGEVHHVTATDGLSSELVA